MIQKNIWNISISLLLLSFTWKSNACVTNTVCATAGASCGPQIQCFSIHSFLRPRPISQDLALELSLAQYDLYFRAGVSRTQDRHWSFQIAPFYYQSTDTREEAQYFLPHGKSSFTIGQNNTSDISSPWLQLLASLSDPYESTVSIRPMRRATGAVFKGYVDFGRYLYDRDCWFSSLWISAYLPVVYAEHILNFCETQFGGPGLVTNITNASQAFNNPTWCYGRLKNKMSKTHTDDLQIKIGWNIANYDSNYWGIYGIVFAPTGMLSTARYLFEPLIGSGHTGVGLGTNLAGNLYEKGCNSLCVLAEARYAYFLQRSEVRSFDLCNGDWTRYLLVVPPYDPNNPIPGINYFTQSVSIKPAGMVEVWLALHAATACWDIEFGYNFWWREHEKINSCLCSPGVAIFDWAGVCRTSASTAGICQAIRGTGQPTSDPVVTQVCNSQINVNSGLQPKAMSNKLYAGASHSFEMCNLASMIGIAGSYEFAESPAALTQWGIWLKASVAL